MRRLAALAAALLLLSACAGVSELLRGPAPGGLRIHPQEMTLAVGDKFRFYATGVTSDGEMHRLDIDWAGSNDRLGLVDATGRVTGIAESGEFTVTATLNDLQATARVRLVPEAEECVRSGTVADARLAYVQLLQATEVGVNGVPAVSGRPLWARISLLSDDPLLLTEPALVQVHVRRDGLHVGTVDAAAGHECLTSSPYLPHLQSTYNAEIPAGWLQGPMEIHVTAGSNLRYPPSGYLAVDDHRPEALEMVLVPVELPLHGLEMSLSSEDAEGIMELHRAVFPLDEVSYSIREPYQYQADDDLSQLLAEIDTLRLLDQNPAFYQAVVPSGEYEAVAAGMGGIGWPVSWGVYRTDPEEWMPRSWTLTHELGHNFGLRHAPCGDPGRPVKFPYTDGRTGTYGVMQFAGGLALATPDMADLMGYCGNRWISDYHYLYVLRNLAHLLEKNRSVWNTTTRGLLVSGTVADGLVDLKPAFRVDAAAAAPQPGDWLWQLLDGAGNVLEELSFEPYELAAAHEEALSLFAFTVPVADELLERAHLMHVLKPDGLVAAAITRPELAAQSVTEQPQARWNGRQTVVTWNPAQYRAVMVLNEHGTVISRGATGRIVLTGKFDRLNLELSTGFTSQSATLQVR